MSVSWTITTFNMSTLTIEKSHRINEINGIYEICEIKDLKLTLKRRSMNHQSKKESIGNQWERKNRYILLLKISHRKSIVNINLLIDIWSKFRTIQNPIDTTLNPTILARIIIFREATNHENTITVLLIATMIIPTFHLQNLEPTIQIVKRKVI